MKTLAVIKLFVALILFGAGILTPSYSQTPEQLYQKGLMKEEGEGALQEAIDLYNQIAENSNADKSIQAKALLHIGMCYEKMGKEEATKAYQKLVNNYPGQKNEVAIARERLSSLTLLQSKNKMAESVPEVMTNKKIWEGQDIDDSGEISPDGKYLSYSDWDTGDLAIYEIETGKKRKLTNLNPGQGSNYDHFAFSPRWSSDSKSIYYSVFVSPELSELRTIGLNHSESKTITKIEGNEKWLEVYDLSNDGNTILATIEINTNKTQIALISLSDGNIRIIKEFPFAGFVENLKFTSDGASIIYDYPPKLESPNHDIYLFSIDKNSETPLIKHQANDFVLGLSPNGKELLFASSRSGQLGFWSIGFENGKTNGIPVLIKTSEHPYLKGLGFTEKGAFVYCHFPSKTDVYETEINPETGEVVNPPSEKVGNFIGANGTPDYSSDGKYLAFVSRRFPFNARQTFRPVGNIICIQSQKDGSIREVRPEISNFGFPKWSPDNSSILVVNWEADNTMGLYNVDIETGIASSVYKGVNQSLNGHEWSLDGKSVFLILNDGNGNFKLVKHNIETDKKLILTEGTWREVTSFSRSADGKWLAFMGRDRNRSLKIIPSSGGEIQEVHSWDQGDNSHIFLCWSADGKYIYTSKFIEPKKDQIWDIWQIPVDGGDPKALGLDLTYIWQISAHPDGKHLAYSNEGSSYKQPQVWLIENFLPVEDKEIMATKELEGITIKQVWTGSGVDNTGKVSLDGKYLSFVDWQTGDVAVRDLVKRENERLTNDGTWEEPYQFADLNIISPDGKQIAFQWYSGKNSNLKIIDINNKLTKTISTSEDGEIYPALWITDTEQLIAQRFNKIEDKYNSNLSSINIKTGEIKILRKFERKTFMSNITLSPDGKYIAFDFLDANMNDRFDINLVSIDGNEELSFIKHPANDRVLGWLPNSNKFIFTSNRTGTSDIWAVKTLANNSVSEPKRILTNVGNIKPLGFSLKGTLYYSTTLRKYNSYIIPNNQNSGELLLNSKTPLLGTIGDVSWLPDSNIVLCVEFKRKANNRQDYKLCLLNPETNEKHKLTDKIIVMGPPRLSPDNNLVLTQGWDENRIEEENYRGGIYTIELSSGNVSQINAKEDVSRSFSNEWSKDGKFIFYTSNNQIIKHEISTGEEHIIYSNEKLGMPVIRRSFGGNNLIFDVQMNDTLKHLKSISVNGGNEELLAKFNTSRTPLMFRKLTLSPDGKYIYLSVDDSESGSILWRVPSGGGEPVKIWHSKNKIAGIGIHPNGGEMAISLYEHEIEIRKIENLANEVEKIFSQNE